MHSNKFHRGFARYESDPKKSNSLIGGTCPHLLIYMKSASSSELLDSWFREEVMTHDLQPEEVHQIWPCWEKSIIRDVSVRRSIYLYSDRFSSSRCALWHCFNNALPGLNRAFLIQNCVEISITLFWCRGRKSHSFHTHYSTPSTSAARASGILLESIRAFPLVRVTESAKQLACGLSFITPFLPRQRCPQLLHLTNCCAVEAAQGFHGNWQESQPLTPAGFSGVPHFPLEGLQN